MDQTKQNHTFSPYVENYSSTLLTRCSIPVNKGWLQKKNGLFNDIDQISFNTHQGWHMKKWLGVGKFTTHPPLRNNDIILGFEEMFQQLDYKGISELFFDAIPSLKSSSNPHQVAVSNP